jgi:hypothetical protein
MSLADLEALADLADTAPAAKRPKPASAPVDLAVEPHSGLRIDPSSRRLSRNDVASLVSSFAVKRIDEVPALIREPPTAQPAAWLTFGVLVDKGAAKPTQRGDSFCVWKFSDLGRPGGSATTISVFLFGEAFSSAWKELPGTIFALLTPRPVPPKDGASMSGDMALSVEKQQQLQRVGRSTDFALCKAERKDGRPCTMWVKASECEYCEYHAAFALKQFNRALAAQQKSQQPQPQRQQLQPGVSVSGQPRGCIFPPGHPAAAAMDARRCLPPNGSASCSSSSSSSSSLSSAPGAHLVSGVPNGMPPAPTMQRPAWSQANQLGGLSGLRGKSRLDEQNMAELLRQQGWKCEAPDPNSMTPFARQWEEGRDPTQQLHIKRTASSSAVADERSEMAMLSKLSSSRGTSSQQTATVGAGWAASATQRASGPQQRMPNPSAFSKAFGHVKADSEEARRIMGGKASGAVMEQKRAETELDKKLGVLQKKDELTEKAGRAKVIEVTAWQCRTCKYGPVERMDPKCKAEGHDLKRHTLKKRGFVCGGCKRHTTVLNKRMPGPCDKCHRDDKWKEAGIRPERRAPDPASEFLARGEEHGRFRNSAPQPLPLSYMSHGGASADAPSRAQHNPNLWQATLPEMGD